MKFLVFAVVASSGLTALSGCLNPQRTQFPTILPRDSRIERRAAEVHDPFPAVETGPATDQRPRGYVIPRTAPRRNMERRQRQLIHENTDDPHQPTSVPLTRKYSNTVRP